ncbi:MAG TPA: glycosyltransferase family 8 protein [Bacilli bacterium]|nr:glycosyltransferase family 8 protein [Bacilli bacterium]HPS18908.1 glycosyltransferase family 8 protein [Bacilli bacterium]
MKTNIIPIFFACDDNYLDYMLVTLASLRDHASENNHYELRVLYDHISLANRKRIKAFEQQNIVITFINVGIRAMRLGNNLGIRDYYTKTTYFRLLLPTLFPKLDKILYLDCDIVIRDDVAKLYATDVGDNLLGASPDYSVNTFPEFAEYVEHALDIPKIRYFNAGIIIMNLKRMRETHFEQKVINLINTMTFPVAQDQDILNVTCRGQVHYFSWEWDAMPLGVMIEDPKIVHFNLIFKPWRLNGVRYEDYFWKYAKMAGVYDKIVERKGIISPERNEKEWGELNNLKMACHMESLNRDYYQTNIAAAKKEEEGLWALQLNLQNID